MQPPHEHIAITQTKQWINDVVIGCNFCPFAKKVFADDKINYQISLKANIEAALKDVDTVFSTLQKNKNIETSFLIFTNSFENFDSYLALLKKAMLFVKKNKLEGIYQIASFHPQYLFDGSDEVDASNYTNRSPYPMLHFLREYSVSKAIAFYKNVEDIPIQNIKYANEKGLVYMQYLFEQSKIDT